jgi:hypothetical protein
MTTELALQKTPEHQALEAAISHEQHLEQALQEATTELEKLKVTTVAAPDPTQFDSAAELLEARSRATREEQARQDGIEACEALIKSLRDRRYQHQHKVLPPARARAFCTPRLAAFHDAARRYESATRAAETAWLELDQLASDLTEGGFAHLHGNQPINGEGWRHEFAVGPVVVVDGPQNPSGVTIYGRSARQNYERRQQA